MNIIDNIKNDLRYSVENKLLGYREKKDYKNYRSTSDTLVIMIGIVERNLSKGLSSHFFAAVHKDLLLEIDEVGQLLDKTILQDDIRHYREIVIAVDKLMTAERRLKDLISCINRMNNLELKNHLSQD